MSCPQGRCEGKVGGGEKGDQGEKEGPLMGGPQCRLSILRNGNVPCRYFRDFPVDFKIVQCHLSNFRKGCRPVEGSGAP